MKTHKLSSLCICIYLCIISDAIASYPSKNKALLNCLVSDELNILNYNAVGNDTTDDTQAFQNALQAAGQLGAKLFVPAGNYRITQMLIVPDGVSIIGDGIGNTPLQTPSTGSILSYEGADYVVKLNGHSSSVRDMVMLDKSNTHAAGGIIIEANGRLCENITLSNVLITGFTAGTALQLEAKNSGGICYCSFYDVFIRNAKTGIHITQSNNSFVNSNSFFHGSISGGGFDYGILIDAGNNNLFFGTIIEPPQTTYAHLAVNAGEVKAYEIRIEGSSQSQTKPLVYFEAGTLNSMLSGTYSGGLIQDKGNNSLLIRTSKSLSYQNASTNQLNNTTFSNVASNKIPEWIVSNSQVTITSQDAELITGHNVVKLTVPAGVSTSLKSTALLGFKNLTIYDQLSFGFFVKTNVADIVLATTNAPAGVASSIPHSGNNNWEFVGMNAFVNRQQTLDCKLVINNTTNASVDVYVTVPTLVFGNQVPLLEPRPITTAGGIISGMLSLSLGSIVIPDNGEISLPKNANYFEVTNVKTITRINYQTGDVLTKGTVVTFLFNNNGVGVSNSAYIVLKSAYTSVTNGSLTLISKGDGTWREVSRNN